MTIMRKTVVITGANRRIGLFLTGYFTSLDYDVIAVVKSPDVSKELQTLKALNPSSIAIIQKDFLTSSIDWDFWDNLKNVDVAGFIHCASIFKHDTIETTTIKNLREHQVINCDSFVEACTSFCQYHQNTQLASPASFISFIDSKVEDLNVDHYSYTISKINLAANIKFLAMTGAPKIRVNGISPGLTLPSGEQTQEEFNNAQQSLPYGYGVNLEDIAQSTAFLMMMPSVNGQTITVDAGQHLQKKRDIIIS